MNAKTQYYFDMEGGLDAKSIALFCAKYSVFLRERDWCLQNLGPEGQRWRITKGHVDIVGEQDRILFELSR